MNRRSFLKLLAAGAVAYELDVDRLLWVRGERTIFIPPASTSKLTIDQIVAIEIERIIPKLRYLFERDNIFYQVISRDTAKYVDTCPTVDNSDEEFDSLVRLK